MKQSHASSALRQRSWLLGVILTILVSLSLVLLFLPALLTLLQPKPADWRADRDALDS